MKKQILIALILSSTIFTINGQWNGTNPLWTYSNVGIGTQTPLAKLQIGGCFNAMPDLTALSFIGGNSLRILNDDGNTNYGAFISGNSSLLKLGTRYAGIDNVILTINQNSVGIGTTNITAPLTVQSGSGANAIRIIGRSDDYGYLEFLKNNGNTVSSAIYSKTDRLTLTDGTGTDVLNLKGGNVGIRTSSPEAILDINTNLPIPSTYNTQKWATSNSNYNLRLSTVWDEHGINQYFIQKFNGVDYNTLSFYCGYVGIGTKTPQSLLAVAGTITAKEVNVTVSGWSDFVFSPTYTLPTLEDLEKYINTNKHLPDVPTEKEVKENGLNLGQNDAVLLQKVEELTLYLIEQNKEIKALKEEIKQLKQNK